MNANSVIKLHKITCFVTYVFIHVEHSCAYFKLYTALPNGRLLSSQVV